MNEPYITTEPHVIHPRAVYTDELLARWLKLTPEDIECLVKWRVRHLTMPSGLRLFPGSELLALLQSKPPAT